MEYVESLTFLDEIQDKIDEKEQNADIAKQLYNLIEKYYVPTPPENLAVYQVSFEAINYFKKDFLILVKDLRSQKFCDRLLPELFCLIILTAQIHKRT